MALFSKRAAALNCTIIAVLNNVILCHRGDDTYITWRARVYIDDQQNGAIFAEFISGCYDMTQAAGSKNLIERAYGAPYAPQGVLVDIVVDHGYSPDNVAAELLHGVQCFDSEMFDTLVSIKGVEL